MFNSSVHCHCCLSDWTGIICICLSFLAPPQLSLRCESDCFSASDTSSLGYISWTRHIFLLVFKWACAHVFTCVWSFQRVPASSIILFVSSPSDGTFHHLRCSAGPREHWAEAKPTAVCGNVWTGTDLYRVWLVSAFRCLIPMSIFRLRLPEFLRWHTINLDFTFYTPKALLKYKDSWPRRETAFGASHLKNVFS